MIDSEFVVADEPTSMLDVSIRSGIMRLMGGLAARLGISYLYITHDLAVARYMCDRIAVMYLGKIVETGETEEVLQNPAHPYTRALIAAAPVPDPTIKRAPAPISGAVSVAIDPQPRCRFYERCPIATDQCRDSDHPPLTDTGGGHLVAWLQGAGMTHLSRRRAFARLRPNGVGSVALGNTGLLSSIPSRFRAQQIGVQGRSPAGVWGVSQRTFEGGRVGPDKFDNGPSYAHPSSGTTDGRPLSGPSGHPPMPSWSATPYSSASALSLAQVASSTSMPSASSFCVRRCSSSPG